MVRISMCLRSRMPNVKFFNRIFQQLLHVIRRVHATNSGLHQIAEQRLHQVLGLKAHMSKVIEIPNVLNWFRMEHVHVHLGDEHEWYDGVEDDSVDVRL